MITVMGVVCLLFALAGWLGQLISALNFPLAQRWGLQEPDAEADALYQACELNTARWDSLVLWTMGAAGALMLLNHPWWPAVALLTAGIHLDTAGRETVKILALRRNGVRTGGAGYFKVTVALFSSMLALSLILIVLAWPS